MYFDFNACSGKVASKGTSFVVSFLDSKEEFYFEPVRQEDVSGWVSMLEEVINKSDGKKHNYNYLSTYIPFFYKKEVALNEEFEKNADSGDIVLFRSQHSAARIQQLFTNS